MASTNPFTAVDVRDVLGLRDELRLQAHLFKAELKDRWLDAERRWLEIEHELRDAAVHSRAELGAATSLTAQALRESYRELRQALHSR